MVPSEYRLEQLAARLTERLEGMRRSYAEDPAGAAAGFRVVADRVVADAVAEMMGEGFADDPARQADLLRVEIERTFLPRYTRLATAMTLRESRGFGAGFFHGPLGRLTLVAGFLLLTALWLRAPGPWAATKFLPFLLGPAAVFVPDLMAWLVRRAYRRDLVTLMDDLRIIQERAGDYAPPSEAAPAATESAATSRRAKAAERGTTV